MLDSNRLAAIEVRLAAAREACPYPLEALPLSASHTDRVWEVVKKQGPGRDERFDLYEDPPEAVARFHAAVPEDVEWLVERVREAQAQIRELVTENAFLRARGQALADELDAAEAENARLQAALTETVQYHQRLAEES